MGISKASARWEGSLKTGNGSMKPEHAGEVPFTVGSRFEGQPSSNPEELIGAALAGCFSMALTSNLEKAGATPKGVRTSAEVKIEKGDAGWSVTSIALTTEVQATGVDDAKFQEVAEATKKGCPVSKALSAVPNVTLKATLKQG
jgi:osmotically inducible protein OsmC